MPAVKTAVRAASSIFRTVRARYLLALTLVALLSTSAYILLSRVIDAQDSSAAVINMSGRQRMLSQRTALFAQQLVLAEGRAERDLAKHELASAIDLLERVHLVLTQVDPARNQRDARTHLPRKPSPIVTELYFSAPLELDAQVRDYIAAVRRLLSAPDEALTTQNPDLRRILIVAPGRLLESLDFVTSQYEKEANEQITDLKRLEAGVWIVTLLALLLEGLLIFYPLERDLSRGRKSLLHNALHDTLTGLPNRALLTDRLEQALFRRRRHPEQSFAVLFLDLNRFKVINDSLGHQVGDRLLVAFSHRLKSCVRELDTVARLGGDEFTILLENVSSLQTAEALAKRINGALEQPFELETHTLHVSTSIGIVLSEAGHRSPEDILRDADIAMYRAKARGVVGFEVFTPEMRERASSLMSLEGDLRGAAERGELTLHYQPIVSLSTGQTTGFEALVRWQHPRHGPISPAEFIPLAEETGLILELDRWVLREGAAQLSLWQQAFPEVSPTLSLNLSSQSFAQPGLVDFVTTLILETGVDAAALHLEITEGVIVTSSETVLQTLSDLKALGLKLHIDDFGTGYSSLSYLQRFPVDTLKIDRSFVDQLTQSEASVKLVQMIVSVAHALELEVVAEGVETQAQLECLQSLSCEFFQGFYTSKPLPAREAERFLERQGEVLEVL